MTDKPRQLKIKNKVLELGKRTYMMGILNVTPDSFSDGGRFFGMEAAFEHARRMADDGADIIDIGGESTRPGGRPVTAEEELQRVIPVIEGLSEVLEAPISVDTYRAVTAELALKAGASMLNDIWGLKHDPDMAPLAAQYKVPVCIMHNRTIGSSYENLIEDMLRELGESIEIALKAGISDNAILIDPGIGFAKTWEQNIQVMRQLDSFKRLGYPILLGTSRKSFIGRVLGLESDDRLEGTMATTAVGIMKGADIVRVHDVLQNARLARMTDVLAR